MICFAFPCTEWGHLFMSLFLGKNIEEETEGGEMVTSGMAAETAGDGGGDRSKTSLLRTWDLVLRTVDNLRF